MKNTRSIFEQVNARRERRSPPALEELNRTLEGLEQQLQERMAAAASRHPRPASPEPRTQREPRTPRIAEPLRGKEFSPMEAELQELRMELQKEMSAGVRRELEDLGRDMARLRGMIAEDGYSSLIAAELSRVGENLEGLAKRTRSEDLRLLRDDLDELEATLQTLALEETANRREERRSRIDGKHGPAGPRHSATKAEESRAAHLIGEQIAQMRKAIDALSDLSQVKNLEENVKVLAAAVERMSRQMAQAKDGDAIATIQERLDEISRAIAAAGRAAAAQSVDRAAIGRLEARIAELANHIGERSTDDSIDAVLSRMDELGRRLDSVAARHETSDRRLDDLQQQMEAIARQLAGGLPASQGVETRIAEVGQRIEEIAADTRAVDHRMDHIAEQVSAIGEHLQSAPLPPAAEILEKLEARMAHVGHRLDLAAKAQKAADPARHFEAVDRRFDELAQRIEDHLAARPDENRLEALAERIDLLAEHLAEAPRPGFAEAAFRGIEDRIADLADHLERSTAIAPVFEQIQPRLDSIVDRLAEKQEAILEAARRVAEQTVERAAHEGWGARGAAVSDLAADLKAIEKLARKSDARNSKTFEAIHDTLLKIVDRLGTLERDASGESAPMFVEAPALAFDESADARVRSAEPAAAPDAAAASIDAPSRENASGDAPSSLLKGLSQAVRKRAKDRPAASVVEPELDAAGDVEEQEALDDTASNRPLEPGSGVPDLNAIMRRVREERRAKDEPGRTEDNRADFIAAARRAAQAAAAESDHLKKERAPGRGGSRRSIGDFVRRQRRPLLIAVAAVIVAMAALQLKSAFLDPHALPAEPAVARQSAPAAQPSARSSASVRDAEVPAPRPQAKAVEATGQDTQKSAAANPDTSPRPAPSAAADTASAQSPTKPAMQGQEASAAMTNAQPAAASPAQAAHQATASASPSAAPASDASQPTRAEPIVVPAEIGPGALRDAASAGNPAALFEIASRYADGKGVQSDLAKAAEWYAKAAERHFAPAEYRLGNLYEKGLGVKRDLSAAKDWYSKAAAQGNASAMHNLAVLLAMGADGPVDNAGAVRWFSKAAELGVRDSQFNLGIMAAKGLGTPQDLEASYKWFAIAARSGDEDAAGKRDEVAKALKPDQLKQARADVEGWKATPLVASANSVEVPDAWQQTGETATAGIDMKKAVSNIQKILIKNGFDPGEPDGVMGQKTRDAITAFQKAHGMEPTGQVDQALVKALLESNK